MPEIPRDRLPDASAALLREGFAFIGARCDRLHTDVFRTRLLGKAVICMRGADAAATFYDPERFERAGVMPDRIQDTLVGRGGVQQLDGERHRDRKAMFMSLMTRASIDRLADLMAREWNDAAAHWERTKGVVLFDEAELVLCRAACAWAGVPLEESEAALRARELGALVDAFGAVGPRHWRGRRARRHLERWMIEIVERIRKRRIATLDRTAAHAIVWHREPDGELLPARVAAVELLNVIRPIVAIATYVVFAAKALHDHPRARAALLTGVGAELDWFVEEVRRFYPFTPFVGARVKEAFTWRGYELPAGTLVLLDVYGTDHDPRRWESPEEFRPARFRGTKVGPFDLIPQGGGDHYLTHRCAGEWVTIEGMKVALAFLTRRVAYDVPQQDLGFDLARIPTRPRSGFVMKRVRRVVERPHLETRPRV